MNICIVNNHFGMGGAEKVVTEIANNLQERGYNLSIIDFSGKNIFYNTVNEDITIPEVIKSRSLKRKIIYKLRRKINNLFGKYTDVSIAYTEQIRDLKNYLKSQSFDVLVMNQGRLTSLVPIIKKEFPDLKIVVWQHSTYEVYMNRYYRSIKKNYIKGLEEADTVICLTEKDRMNFKKHNSNTKTIYNPLTIDNKNIISDLTNKNIIFVGRLEIKAKGLDYLLEIAKSIPEDWKVLVAGDGPDKKQFISMINQYDLENKVILKGPLQNNELINLYSKGSVFVSTSRWEGFGLVITEAMAFGLPIISFDNSGPREILDNGKFGVLIESDNIEEFKIELNKMIRDQKRKKYYQEKSLSRVNDFQKNSIVDKWERVISNLH